MSRNLDTVRHLQDTAYERGVTVLVKSKDIDEMKALLIDLIDTMHEQAQQLDKVFIAMEQTSMRLPEYNQLSAITARLEELKLRAKHLLAA